MESRKSSDEKRKTIQAFIQKPGKDMREAGISFSTIRNRDGGNGVSILNIDISPVLT